MDLGFDGDDLGLKCVVGVESIFYVCAVNPVQNFHAMSLEQCFPLVFMDVHCITNLCEQKTAFELCGRVLSILQTINTTT